jgi:CheY-like chemotaxis protein
MKLTVVVVEDHVESADGLGELLALWGHRAHVAYDGESALPLVRDVRPDVALIDIGLPAMDGNALATEIRALDAGPGMLLVALTGYRDAGVVCPDFDRHLEKPVALDVLERLLSEHARRSG